MRPTVKYWIFLFIILFAVFGVILGSLAAAWHQITLEEQDFIAHIAHRLIPFPLIGATFLFLIIGGLVSLLFYFYVVPILRLGEETKLISAVNPSYRIQPKGAPELVSLAGIINESADAFETLQAEVKEKIKQARSDLQHERNLLAALMSDLPTGVLACNVSGQVLLYNQQAQKLLQKPGKLIGLGRSLFSILDRGPIVHAIDMLHQATNRGQKSPTSNFVLTVGESLVLRIHMAPVYKNGDTEKTFSGFVLAMEDLSRQIENGLQREQIFYGLTDTLTSPLEKIRQTLAILVKAPPHETKQQTLLQDIDRSVSRMTETLQQAEQSYKQQIVDIGHHENILGEHLLNIIEHHLRHYAGIAVTHCADQELWLQVDSYAMVQCLAQLVTALHNAKNFSALALKLHRTGTDRALFEIAWPGCIISSDELDAWQNRPLVRDAQDQLISFGDLIQRIGGTFELSQSNGQLVDHLSILLPIAETEEHFSDISADEHRPIHYEFGLLHQVCKDDICQLPLSRLTYVVFDTETTGLKPSQGDEIIQIGAVRIVNGRILYEETLDQLIDPRRPVPEESVKIHGISPELLLGKPTIDEALPELHHFTEGSVLVAHNAAFDMKFLKVKEASSGVQFDQPVLDTLLLSWFVHPNQQSHQLEEVASRLGVPIVGRHTALGDAMVTAEVLCKLIPLLAAKGVHTLEQAMEASMKAPFAHLDIY
jgi:DNA polymerase-3 subunit epsilon